MNPKILIAGPEANAGYLQPYADAVSGAGGEVELDLPAKETTNDENALKEFLRPFQGVLLPGGTDIEPGRYGEGPHERLKPPDCGLDESQLAIARFVLRHDLPTLAICRGLQILAVAVGFDLFQDLSSQRPSSVNHLMSGPENKNKMAHEVVLDENSRLARLSGSARFQVNSRHHQAIRERDATGWAGPFKVVARAPDGVVEGMEHPAQPFLVAVQWHPENLTADHSPSQGLFRGFIEAAGRAHKSR
ncbi:MAG: gamma-glutamyl-gamma-aminobutyrate hydrolase family protein [Candidatus Aminicenantales bacterium]